VKDYVPTTTTIGPNMPCNTKPNFYKQTNKKV